MVLLWKTAVFSPDAVCPGLGVGPQVCVYGQALGEDHTPRETLEMDSPHTVPRGLGTATQPPWSGGHLDTGCGSELRSFSRF